MANQNNNGYLLNTQLRNQLNELHQKITKANAECSDDEFHSAAEQVRQEIIASRGLKVR